MRRCPVYEWMKPDAYNYSLSKDERARVLERPRNRLVGKVLDRVVLPYVEHGAGQKKMWI